MAWRGRCYARLGRLATGPARVEGSRLLGVKVKAPILEQGVLEVLAPQSLPIVGFDSEFSLTPDVLDVRPDSPHGSGSAGYLDHDLRAAIHRAGDVIALRRR
jgi:hypothetical protein